MVNCFSVVGLLICKSNKIRIECVLNVRINIKRIWEKQIPKITVFFIAVREFFPLFYIDRWKFFGLFIFVIATVAAVVVVVLFFLLFILVTVYCCLFAISDSLYTKCNGSEFKSIIVFDSAAQLNPKQKHVKRSQNLSQ